MGKTINIDSHNIPRAFPFSLAAWMLLICTAGKRTIVSNHSMSWSFVLNMKTTTDKVKPNKAIKEARLEARVTIEQKQLMERAAALRGQNLTEFMISTLAEASAQIVKDGELIELTNRDRQVFADALLNPPPPSDRAVADASWYQQVMGQ
jgi:uncharacterized protein (DUF1778 family)